MSCYFGHINIVAIMFKTIKKVMKKLLLTVTNLISSSFNLVKVRIAADGNKKNSHQILKN